MKQNQWFAVRCCCTPTKVFGFIKLQSPPEHMSFPIYQTLTDIMGDHHTVKLMSIYDNRQQCRSLLDYDAGVPVSPVIDLPLQEIAIYSDDRPIEFWRTIKGFVEAPSKDTY